MIDLIARLRGEFFRQICNRFRKNIVIGPGLKIYKKISISGPGRVIIGSDCTIRGMVGDDSQYVCLDTHTHTAKIIIGNNVRLYAARVSAKFEIKISDDVNIEASGIVDTNFHTIEPSRSEPQDESIFNSRVFIGNRVNIGARSFITKGVIVEDDVIIYPGSIVTSSLKSGVTVCGNPARPIKF